MRNEKEELRNCHDCGAKPGEIHMDGCDTERCSVCGSQRLQCDGDPECDEHDKAFARWTGIWPGYAECQLLGLTLNDLYDHNLYKIFFVKPSIKN
jgi:hypothetical protein